MPETTQELVHSLGVRTVTIHCPMRIGKTVFTGSPGMLDPRTMQGVVRVHDMMSGLAFALSSCCCNSCSSWLQASQAAWRRRCCCHNNHSRATLKWLVTNCQPRTGSGVWLRKPLGYRDSHPGNNHPGSKLGNVSLLLWGMHAHLHHCTDVDTVRKSNLTIQYK